MGRRTGVLKWQRGTRERPPWPTRGGTGAGVESRSRRSPKQCGAGAHDDAAGTAAVEAEMPWSKKWKDKKYRRDRWKCGEQQTPPSQTLWRWCPCRRRRRRRGRDVPQRCWRCHLIQRRNALHHLDSCGARYCLVIIEPSALQQTSPDIHAAMMLELPLPPRVAQMPSHTSPDY